MESINIQSGQGDYQVAFSPTVSEIVLSLCEMKDTHVLIDQRVADLYRSQLSPLIERFSTLEIPATEDEKSLLGVGKVCNWLQSLNATKQTRLIAIGGGIIQDIATFTSHIYYRGISWTYIPTTLLGMCDSCIGAKGGINLNSFKNQLGVFQSPKAVSICPEFIETLDDRDVASGYGEMLKLFYINSQELIELLFAEVKRHGLRNSNILPLIRSSLEVKRKIIEKDEYESDLRRILNYGHTFGHALEAVTNHEIPHGLAVVWGMDLINFLAVQRGLIHQSQFDLIHGFIQKYLPFQLSRAISGEEIIRAARRDKKVVGDYVSLILPQGPGHVGIFRTLLDSNIESQISEYLTEHDVFRGN